MEASRILELSPQERVVLGRFRSLGLPTLRFAQVGALEIDEPGRASAVHSLVSKGILARLGQGGEYWLTDHGVKFLGLA